MVRPRQPAAREAPATLFDRFALALLGAFTGALYGAAIAFALFAVTGQGEAHIVGLSSAVFAALGIFFGNVVVDALLVLIHFLWGLACGVAGEERLLGDGSVRGLLRSVLLLGFGTGLVLLLRTYF
jgi:integral membrane sensor domain MASE1